MSFHTEREMKLGKHIMDIQHEGSFDRSTALENSLVQNKHVNQNTKGMYITLNKLRTQLRETRFNNTKLLEENKKLQTENNRLKTENNRLRNEDSKKTKEIELLKRDLRVIRNR